MKAACLLLILAASMSSGQHRGNKSEDNYPIDLVRSAMKLNTMYERVVVSPVQKNIHRLGDSVSIAILKIFDNEQLRSPSTVESFLPVIREAFARPDLIANVTDRAPRITLFLLTTLSGDTTNARLNEDIQKTIAYVEKQVGSGY